MMYSMYVLDIFLYIICRIYLIVSGNHLPNMNAILSEELAVLSAFFKVNKLSLNINSFYDIY